MPIIRPRLNDFYNLPFTQKEADFAIPFLDEDLPLYVDPFLLWKSPSQQDQALHLFIVNAFNHLGHQFTHGNETKAVQTLIAISECDEVGLGNSRTRVGKPFGEKVAVDILSLYQDIPQVKEAGFRHFEEIQLLVDNVAKDRISDITCNFAKSFLIDYTIHACKKHNIPLSKSGITVYDGKTNSLVQEDVELPQNPQNRRPVILVPRHWLRYIPWINYDDYFAGTFVPTNQSTDATKSRVEILIYNRQNYDCVQGYTQIKERQQADCKNDPLFKAIPVTSVMRKLDAIKKLPTGKDDNADKNYENWACPLMASLLYPELDFADTQSRTESGVSIRDLIFYNNRSYPFLQDIYDKFECRQIVVELKNVKALEREHINQLNRYLNDQFGKFGIILTRHEPDKQILKNTIDLWAGQRKCILILTDDDLGLMCQVFKSKQRFPLEVIQKKFVEFTRACPA